MIQKLIFAHLTSAEFYQFLALIVGNVDNADATKSKIKTERDALAALLPKLKTALNREESYSLTKVIEDLDARRDVAITGFYMHINTCCMHPKTAIKAAAMVIKDYLKPHGAGIATLNYQTETAILTKIVDDCKNNTALKAACVTVGASDWLTEIETANTTFIEKYQARSGEMGVKADAESFYSLRKPAVQAYNNLIEILESRYRTAVADNAATIDALKKCVDDINANVTQFKQLIKASQSRKATPE